MSFLKSAKSQGFIEAASGRQEVLEVRKVRELLTRRRTSRRAGSIVRPTVHWTHMFWCVTSAWLLSLTSLSALSAGPAATGAAVSGDGAAQGPHSTQHSRYSTVHCALCTVQHRL